MKEGSAPIALRHETPFNSPPIALYHELPFQAHHLSRYVTSRSDEMAPGAVQIGGRSDSSDLRLRLALFFQLFFR